MTKTPYYKTLTKPQVFVWRMFLFVVLAVFIGIILYNQIFEAFKNNPGLNGLIIGTLIFGVIYTFQQVVRLYPEIRWVNSFRISDPGLTVERPPVMLAPMATLLRRRQGQAALSTAAMRSILDSIAARLDESRETTRYLVGLLVFLGLLGTFWGLMQTVQSVGQTIGALAPSSEGGAAFEELKSGLEAPLKGMGVAFSSSLFGLAGSLIVGFLDLQASQAQKNGCPASPRSAAPRMPSPRKASPRSSVSPCWRCSAASWTLPRRLSRASRGATITKPFWSCPKASTGWSSRCAPSRKSCANGWTSRLSSIMNWPPCCASRTSSPQFCAMLRSARQGPAATAERKPWPGPSPRGRSFA
jgi:MotA/TolQ/ExbB proton channel family